MTRAKDIPVTILDPDMSSRSRRSLRILAVHLATLGVVAACSNPGIESPGPKDAGSSQVPSGETTGSGTNGETPDQGPCGAVGINPASEGLFEPPELANLPLDGIGGTLIVYSSTLKVGPDGLELYAGICNVGVATLCSAALQVEFYGQADQLIGTASGAVQSGRLYSFSQSPYPISCLLPGQRAMAALVDLPEGLAIADVKSMGHRFPAFQIDDAVLIPSTSVTNVEPFETEGGTVFRGMVTNDSTARVADPVVSVFALTEVGRPLGNATSTGTVEIAPGGTWMFETNTVTEAGVQQVAFATGRLLDVAMSEQ